VTPMANNYQTKVHAVTDRAMAWRIAKDDADRAKALLVAAIQDGDSVLSEYTMATAAGVQRSTIRAWLGK